MSAVASDIQLFSTRICIILIELIKNAPPPQKKTTKKTNKTTTPKINEVIIKSKKIQTKR